MKTLLMLFGAVILTLTVSCLKEEPDLPLNQVVKVEVIDKDSYDWEGSGVFIEDDLILTAGHIVDGANDIWITWSDGRRHKAISWYLESEADLGLIYIRTLEEEESLNFDDARLGETVWAYGNPYGVFPILSKGIISAVNASDDFTGQKDMVVTDTAINPGNSGCALFNKYGDVLGICSWKYNNSQGMSYFVRADICRLMLEKYKAIKKLEEIE